MGRDNGHNSVDRKRRAAVDEAAQSHMMQLRCPALSQVKDRIAMVKLQHHHSYPTDPIIDLSSLPGEILALLIVLAFAGVPSFRLFTHIIKSNYSSLYPVSYSVNSSPGMQSCPFSLSTMLEYRLYYCFFLFYSTIISHIYLSIYYIT